MKDQIKQGIFFVRNNLTIVSSIALIFVVVASLFLNAYFAINRFEDHQDKTLRSKAVMAEDVINIAAMDYFDNIESAIELQNKITSIQARQPEITEINLLAFNKEKNDYQQIVGVNSSQTQITKNISENAIKFALSVNDAFAYISTENGVRFWNVAKAVRSQDGSIKGVLTMKMSLAENDSLVRKTIFQVYFLSIIAVIIVLLLVINHIRLFEFEVKARKLEEIDHMKDDFISMASHELKSPLTAIRGYSELIGEALGNNSKQELEQQKKYLHNIDISAERLRTLVEDLLDVSRIEQSRLPIVCKKIEIDSIVEGIIVEMQVMAEQKQLTIENNLPTLSPIYADPERVKQIVVNLISNAIKYTPKGGIKLLGKEDEEYVYVTVADTGLGISPENMQKLFSKFFRVRSEQTSKITGTGLGLWITKEITEKMGGQLSVESIEGVGSHFTLKFKKAK